MASNSTSLRKPQISLWTQTIPWGKYVMWELVRWPAVLLGKYSHQSGSGWHTLFFLSWFPQNSTSKCKCQIDQQNDVSWIHTRTFNNQQLQVKLTSFSPSWLSWSWGFAEISGSWGFQPLEQHPADYASVKTYPVFFRLVCGETKNKHQDLGNSKNSGFNSTFLFFYRFCFITLILDSYMTHHFSKKNPIVTGKCWVWLWYISISWKGFPLQSILFPYTCGTLTLLL